MKIRIQQSHSKVGGMMSEDDLEFIISSQNRQVHTAGSQWIDDFYYQALRLRKGTSKMTTDQIRKLRIPIPGAVKTSKSDKRNSEKQKEKMEALANSLGIAPFQSSSRAPHRRLEVPVDENRTVGGFKAETEDGADLDTSNFLVLLTAEKCASVLVDIRDLEILMETDELDAFFDTLTDQKDELIESLFELLRIDETVDDSSDDLFLSMLFTNKARRIVAAAIQLFNSEQTLAITNVLLRNIVLCARRLTKRSGQNWSEFVEEFFARIPALPKDDVIICLLSALRGPLSVASDAQTVMRCDALLKILRGLVTYCGPESTELTAAVATFSQSLGFFEGDAATELSGLSL